MKIPNTWLFRGNGGGSNDTTAKTFQRSWESNEGFELILRRSPVTGGVRFLTTLLTPNGDVLKTWTGNSSGALAESSKNEAWSFISNYKAQVRAQGAKSILDRPDVSEKIVDTLKAAYECLSDEQKQMFAKKVWPDVLRVFGIE